MEIEARSVSSALSQGLHALCVRGIKQESRVGDVLVMPVPVMTTYLNPTRRVLFSPMRDANPFFHVMEALWMLAGRNDLPWLTYFNRRFAAYSDDGGQTQPGAYGYRWRSYFGYDQLETLIVELKNNPQTRRCVLAMWDGGTYSTKIGDELYYNEQLSDLLSAIGGSADVPCNTHAYFDTIDGKLNMTVCCRSNDIIWGAYGANAVHFSFLLEYVSAMTGIPMGVYRQFSNNFHLYTNVVPEAQIMPMSREVESTDQYESISMKLVPLVSSMDDFLEDLNNFMTEPLGHVYANHFFPYVALPMWNAWARHKEKDYDAALATAKHIYADDWRIACEQWLMRRKLKHELNAKPFTEVVGRE